LDATILWQAGVRGRPGGANSPKTDGEAGNSGRALRFTPDPARTDLSPEKQTHIIEGDSNPRTGMGGGAHYPNSNNIRINETSIDMDGSGNGVFKARVEIKDANGNFVPKGNAASIL
jgi:hypothetical protein